MLETKLDQRLMGYITTIENLTGARVKDIFVQDDLLIVIVPAGEAGKAIGKRGAHIRRLTYLLKKKIKIIELSTSALDFTKNALDPLKVDSITLKNNVVVLSVKEASMKGKIIGRNGKNLKLLSDLVQKYFGHKAVVS